MNKVLPAGKRTLAVTLLVTLSTLIATGQQVPDTIYSPPVTNPAYEKGHGPLVFIDEGHHNFHTRDNRYLPFALLLEKDGYNTAGYSGTFDLERLSGGKILVISNAMNEFNVNRWYKPVYPAFTDEEIMVLKEWVSDGGSLFLIADHMPMGGAASSLAAIFGFSFTDGFAVDTSASGPALFCRKAGTLADNIITRGRYPGESVDSVYSFTGQAFTIPEKAEPVLLFDKRYTLILSDTAWVFDSASKFKNIDGWSQLAYTQYGRGRVVAAGEAAMYSAQLAGPDRMPAGMNSPFAKHNYQLLLNIIHWLDGLTEE